MKIIHLSDLHLGKRVNEFSMLEDQKNILGQILDVIDQTDPETVIIAGDVYDKSVPSAEAVELFDDFLYELAKRKLQVFIISGNHDSPERIAFANRLIDLSGIHLSPVYNGTVMPVTLEDSYGPVSFYMLPFVKPSSVRRFFEDTEIVSYTDAVRTAVGAMKMDQSQRNVLVTHQFVTGAFRSESEDIMVGGTDNIDASVFDGIDYVALGHIHGPQNIGSERIRYCGTPLKYSFSEANHIKSVTIVTLKEKGDLSVETIPLKPVHDMREVRGFFAELMKAEDLKGLMSEDYLHVILTDEEEIPNAMDKLRTVFPNIMKLDYDNTRTRSNGKILGADAPEKRSPFELLAEFYELQNGKPLSEEQKQFSKEIIEKIWEERA